MKLSTIAKTSLALGILTTGVMTTYAQSADANSWNNSGVSIINKETKDLYDYYNGPHWNLNDVNGTRTGDKVSIVYRNVETIVDLVGTDRDRFKNENLSNIDVFVVGEGTSKQATNYSIGGITKTNDKNYTDHVTRVPLNIEKNSKGFKSSLSLPNYTINKKEISLKELDFKLRNKLIKEQQLYSNGNTRGKITVKMKNRNIPNDYYTFDLSEKLQKERMGDVIVDTTKIDRIDVEYK